MARDENEQIRSIVDCVVIRYFDGGEVSLPFGHCSELLRGALNEELYKRLFQSASENSQQMNSETPVVGRATEDIMSIVKRISYNEANIRRLVQQAESPLGVVPFVGAGLSIPFGFPSWTDFLVEIATTAGIKKQITTLLRQNDYEGAAELIKDTVTDFALCGEIEDKYGNHRLPSTSLIGALKYIPSIAKGPVITTNFDRLVETVFSESDKPFEIVVYGAKPDLINRAMQQSRTRLLKIHGDWEERSERILTKSEYGLHYGTETGDIDESLPLPRLLGQVIVGRPLLFVGCSLNQDRTVKLMHKIARKSPGIYHFAIVEQPQSDAGLRKKARFLAEHNIYPIWYLSKQYHMIETILEYVAKHCTT